MFRRRGGARPLSQGARAPTTAGRAERWIFFVAISVIGVRVLDDNFIQPEAGTGAGDHLLSGLVPLAALAVAAAAYPGRRAGGRAAIAILVGLFGVAAGLEGWHYLTSASPSGDDFSSLFSLPAGLGLLGLAGVTLWRSRRTDDGHLRRYLRRSLIGLAGAVVIALLVVPFLAAYGFTHLARGFVPKPDLGADYEEVTFTTEDGLDLDGWYIPSRNGAAVISFAGRKDTQDPARLLAEHGYGVLLFDRRGEGESDGEPNAWGWGGYRDVDAAVEFLLARGVAAQRIGGIGQSVGRDDARGRRQVRRAEGGRQRRGGDPLGPRSRGALRRRPAREIGVALQTAGVALFSNESVPPNLVELVGQIAPRPLLLIYALEGAGGEELNEEYHRAAGQPKGLWAVAEGGHVGSQAAEPEEYERRVVRFFDAALLGRGPG